MSPTIEQEMDQGKLVKEVALAFGSSESPGVYATNIIVQHTEHEFTISFYEAMPTPVVGSQERKQEIYDSIESIPARCVARVVVAAGRMETFLQVLKTNFENHQMRFT